MKFQQPQDSGLYQATSIPCGQCILCRLEHARQWAVRITHEAQQHDANCFITLTYDDEHLPEHGSLNYEHLRNFWKRIRRGNSTRRAIKLRYYAVGEYGDNTLRPHYHACIFGQAFTEDRVLLRTTPHMLWTNPLLQDAWGLGHVSVGALTFQTAQYTASYVTKKLNNQRRYVRVDQKTGELVPLVQPRALMSRWPPIGAEWLNQHRNYTYAHDHVVIDGRRQKPPKAYDRWLAKTSPDKAEQVKRDRRSRMQRLTPDQTHARAENARARARMKNKTV